MIKTADDVYGSRANVWEATKFQLGKLSVEPARLADAVSSSGFSDLLINIRHAVAVAHLSALHRDPLDRILLARDQRTPIC
jgi:PIN domain nuclease of toxin-antitoxin system